MQTMRIISAFLPLLAALTIRSGAAEANPLARDSDPVVMTGGSLGSLAGEPVDRIVAFRYEGGWQQIPMQIDERKWIDFAVVYNEPAWGYGTTAYVDSGTYVGPDSDPTFDSDDELVVMGRDAGGRAPAWVHLPDHAAAEGVEAEITDPLTGERAYVYLFPGDGMTDQSAGRDDVSYRFRLLAGTYMADYGLMDGPNPEDSEVVSSHYRTHFADRWKCDELNVYAGGAGGADILDRHKNMFAPGNCARTEDTFCNGEGAFFTNKDGPLRAIRSYMGANSGPFTQREHLFYERRQDVTTHLRVHPISGVMDLYDYSPSAAGMTYYNELNTGGVAVDGVPDAIVQGPLTWEMVTGIQGTVIIAEMMDTNIPSFSFTSYYSDDSTPSVTQCTGDAFEYATCGLWVNQGIPNTDPSLGAYNLLAAKRVIYYEPPGQTVADAAVRSDWARNPLGLASRAYPRTAPGDFDGDGDVDVDDVDAFRGCMTGPDVGTVSAECVTFDIDGDADIDSSDFGVVQRCLSGPEVPAQTRCAE